MSFVAIDLGASSTRFVSDSGNVAVLPNNSIQIPMDTVSDLTPDAPDIESCLEVQIVKGKADESGYFPTNVLVGIMADRKSAISDRPEVTSHKHLQRINYVNAVIACAVNMIKYPIESSFDLYLAVPPIEVLDARKAFADELLGEYTVTFPKYMGGTKVTFNIKNVYCYEESLMAVSSFFFNMNGTMNDEHKKYLAGTVLSIDIGASTMDMLMVENGRYKDRTAQTYKTGGNVARDELMNGIARKYAIDIPLEAAERTMAEGRLQMGNQYVDVSDLVSESKEHLAKVLTQHMQTYFKRINIPINMINTVIVSGGGSLQSQYVNADSEIVKTSEPMSYFVTKELQSQCAGVETVSYGSDARYANIRGLFIKAKMDIAREQKKAEQENAAKAAEASGATA